MRLRSAAVVAVACAVALRADALDPRKAVTQYVHDVWRTEHGLPQDTVSSLAQTRDGYLWLGTQGGGLVRFDGVRFSVFDRSNTPELKSDWISALLADSHGDLWIGTLRGGVSRLHDGNFTSYAPFARTEGRVEWPVTFHEDRRGGLWVAGDGLARFERDAFTRPSIGGAPAAGRVRALAEDGAGNLWIAREGAGLLRVRGGETTVFSTKDGLADDDVTCLYRDREGGLWIGTPKGLGLRRDGAFATFSTRDGLPGDSITCLLEDAQGTLWVGTSDGLARRTGDGFVAVRSLEELTGEIGALFEDRERSLWIGSSAGLNRLRDGKFTTFTTAEGLANDAAWSVFEDRAGAVWVGSGRGGLNRIVDGRVSDVTAKGGFAIGEIHSFLEDRRGRLWIGGTHGLALLAGGALTPVSTGRSVSALAEDREGSLWFGTEEDGLFRLREGAFAHYTRKDGLAEGPVLAIHEDREGSLWAGTGGGVSRLRDGRFTTLTTKDGLPDDRVAAFHEDRDGALWLAVLGGGLVRLQGGRLAVIGSKKGLFDEFPFAILEDDRGDFWMSCSRGVFTASRSALDAVADGKASRVSCVSYGTADGMKRGECSGGAGQPAAWKGRDGRLWFPTTKGVAVIDPARLRRNELPPPVVLEEVRVDGAAVRSTGAETLALGAGVRKLEFRYTAPSFLAPQRVRFRVRLDGYDKEWVDTGGARSAQYTNLPPRAYTFRVVACNEDGVWNEAGASFAFRLLPRWWSTWWARLLEGAALLGMAFLLVSLRVRALQRRTEELERKVEERTAALAASERRALASRKRASEANRAKSVFLANMSHELRTPLNGILGFAQLMTRRRGRDGEDRESLEIITRSGEHLLELIDDVLSLSKIEAGKVSLSTEPFDPGHLVKALVSVLGARAAGGVDVTLDAQDLPAVVTGDERKLRQILTNLLNNALRLTERGHVTLRARWDAGRGAFEVEDTGPGIAEEEIGTLFTRFVQTEAGRRSREGTGLGLALSRELARLMGGDITVTSRKGAGSTFRLEVDLPGADASSLRAHAMRVVALAPGHAPPRVVVADDVAENRLLLSRLLSSVGFEVREAATAEEAVAGWREFAPALVLIDKRMPGMGGLEAVRRIREEERRSGRAKTAIMAVSASAMEHERGEILASGCDEFLAKPFREATLFARIAALIPVRYRYGSPSGETPAIGIDAARVARLPGELRETLRTAFLAGDFNAAQGAAERVRPLDAPLADALAAAARSFEAEEVLAALNAP